MTYVIRLNGFLCGGFKGADEDEALSAYASLEGFDSFKNLLVQRNLKRDNFTVEEVTEAAN